MSWLAVAAPEATAALGGRTGPHGDGTLIVGMLMAAMGLLLLLRFVPWFLEWGRWWVGDRRRRLLALALVSLLVFGALGTRYSRLDLRYSKAAMHRAEVVETAFLPPPEVLAVLGVGQQSFVADLLFLRANLYFVAHLFGDRIFSWLDTYAHTILALDPDNPRVYEWASQAVKFGQLITHEALERSNAYARRGIERFPDHWRFYFDIGFNYLVEWRPKTEEEHERMRKKALPWFSVAAALPDSELDPNFVAELYLRESDVEMALFHAYLRYFEASDREKDSLLGRINRYESTAVAEELARTEAEWRATWPYLPLTLYELLGSEVKGGVPASWIREGS